MRRLLRGAWMKLFLAFLAMLVRAQNLAPQAPNRSLGLLAQRNQAPHRISRPQARKSSRSAEEEANTRPATFRKYKESEIEHPDAVKAEDYLSFECSIGAVQADWHLF
jgi:hypothetical protein